MAFNIIDLNIILNKFLLSGVDYCYWQTIGQVKQGNDTKVFISLWCYFFSLLLLFLQISLPKLSVKRLCDVSPAAEKSIPKLRSIILPLAQTDLHLRFASYQRAWHFAVFDWRFISAADFVWRDGVKIMPISHLMSGQWDVE